jgi:hypothetical protein
MEVLGYKYKTEQQAIDARESCDSYFGIPVSPEDTTQNWCEYQIAELNSPVFWYIVFDESLIPVLGNPEYFEVVEQPIVNKHE